MSPEKRSELLSKMKEIKEAKQKREKVIVFFGNGTMGGCIKGYESIPWKTLVRCLCSKGICVVTDEFCTSKLCGGCGGEMVNKDGKERRVRCCKNNLTGKYCPLFSELERIKDGVNRDEDAVAKILLCGRNLGSRQAKTRILLQENKKKQLVDF